MGIDDVSITANGTVPTTPTITVTPTTALSFTTTTGTSSTAQSYAVSGSNLTAAITATAPSGYEVALESATAGVPGAFGAFVATVAPSSGTVAATTIYVRLTGAALGTYGTSGTPFNVVHTSTGVSPNVNKPVYGTVTAPTPTITLTPATVLSFATTPGTPSTEQSYVVDATALTANLTVTAPAGYEISLTSGTYTGTGANTLTLTPSGGTVSSTTIYVRLTGATAGTYGTVGTPLNITHISTGATTKNIAVSGTVTAPALATYSLVAPTTGKSASAPATAKDPNISTATDITRSSTLSTSGVATGAGIFGASSWGALTNLADAQAADKYFAFAITPTLGFLANVSSIAGNAYRTSTAPTTIELLYSTNSDFTNPVSLGTQSIAATAAPGTAFSFTPGTTVLQNVAFPIYFRLYGYGSTNTAGNFYLSNGTSSPGLVVNGTTVTSPLPVIATGTVSPTSVCGGSPVTVSYATGSLAPTGTYFVQLSDATGSFASPVSLTTVSNTASSVTATIPGATASGTNYRVRVANTDGTIGSTSVVFTVVSSPTATIAPPSPQTQTINVGTTGTALTVTETPAAVSRQWYYGTASGGPYTTAISGATNTTYIPAFSVAGTYYVVAQSAFTACGSVISNEVIVTVTVPTLTATPTALTGFTTNTGTASAAQTYTLMATALTAPITVTAPTGFEVSLDGITFAASVSATVSGASAGQTVYVRLLGSSLGSPSGSVTNTVGTTSVNVTVSGDVLTSPGTLLVEDDFDYIGQLKSNGWSGTANSSTIAGNITASMYPQGGLAAGATSYQAKIFGTSGSSLTRIITVPTGTTTLYASALINVSSAQNSTGGDYLLAFQTLGTVSYLGRVTIAKVPSSSPVKFTFKIRAGNETTATVESTPTQFSIDTDYLLVMKAENSSATGNSDRFSLYVLPTSANLSQEPSSPLLTIDGVNVFGNISAFNIRQTDANNPTFTFDSFRMATGWGTVVGNAVYSAPTADINAGSYYNVTVNNSSQVSQAGAVTVEHQLALPGGKFDLNGRLLTLLGTVSGSGSLVGSATSNLSVLGTGALGTLNFAASAQALNNLTLNRSTGTLTLGSPLSVGGTLALMNGIISTDATNLLTLATGTTISGGSATSFVNGQLARVTSSGAATTLFPIGRINANNLPAYRPITLTSTAQTSVTTYTAVQNETPPTQNLTTPDPSGTDLVRVSYRRYFNITPTAQPTGFSGTVTLSFDADDFVNYPADPSFVIAKRGTSPATLWNNIGRSANTGTSMGGAPVAGTLTSLPFTSFSDFSLASTSADGGFPGNNPLPVELTVFTAQRQADALVAVKWTTASEKNSARFDVQRSLNGREFATVAAVAAQGTSTSPTAYTALDKTAPAAILYYRLRQVDRDGTVAFSPVVTVAGSTSIATKVLLYPNPAHSTLSFIAESATPYRVLNQLGQALLSGTTATGTATVSVETLPTGLYFLELQTATGRVVQKFEKE